MKNNNQTHLLSTHDLKFIQEEKFRPRVLKEYFEEDGVCYRNTFAPTKYMQLTGELLKEPKAILDLLYHLVNYDTTRYHYLLNWLAFFFKYLKKSQIAIVLIGDQGAGKGILFYIISKLFGEKYCITINDTSLNTNYKAKIIENKLFINLDEISLNTSIKNESFIKALITNPSISLEEKNVTMEKETELHGQCLFTSNNKKALQLPKDDRRKVVLSTGGNLINNNYLNYGSYDNLKLAVDSNLEDFAKFLKNYEVDIRLANIALDTPEKRVMINASQDNLADFHKAIIDMDIFYFSELQETNMSLYNTIHFNFNRGLIDRADMTKAYNALYSGKNISTKDLMAKLRELKPQDIFTDENMSHSGSIHYYHLIGRK